MNFFVYEYQIVIKLGQMGGGKTQFGIHHLFHIFAQHTLHFSCRYTENREERLFRERFGN